MTPDAAALLTRLGLDAEPPSADALARIHRAQVERVPYETVWIHMDERLGIDPADSLRRVGPARRGGYCYQLNGALSLLLGDLGYRVTRHVGGVHGTDGPDVDALTNHLVLVVHDLPTDANPGGRWYVDAGLGDGLHDPLPLLPGTYGQGPMTFVLAETDDGVGDWHLDHDPTGSFAGMSFRAGAVDMDVFTERHTFLSTSPDSSFAGTVTAQLRRGDGTDVLRGCVMSRRTGADTVTETVDRREDWFALLADEFAIRPDAPPAALDALWARVIASHETWLAERADT
ncbi:MAG: arylamine N-acetyltransferase [Ilumatobacteraceae bacterium]